MRGPSGCPASTSVSHGVNEESLALFRDLEDDMGIAVLLHRLGISTLGYLEDPEKARELLNESLEQYRRAGSERGESEVLGGLGYVSEAEGDLEVALELFSPPRSGSRGGRLPCSPRLRTS